MNRESKEEFKKNVATGASTAAGAAAGVVIGAALTSEQVSAQEVPTPEPTPQPAPTAETIATPKPTQESTTQPESSAKTEPAPKPQSQPTHVAPHETQQDNDEVEVIGYDRLTNEYGAQMDVAVLKVNGNEVGVMDVNLDGEADAIIFDANQNGIIEDDEIHFVQDEGIAMQQFADAAGFSPLYAQNDLPDYVNDADIDTFMV